MFLKYSLAVVTSCNAPRFSLNVRLFDAKLIVEKCKCFFFPEKLGKHVNFAMTLQISLLVSFFLLLSHNIPSPKEEKEPRIKINTPLPDCLLSCFLRTKFKDVCNLFTIFNHQLSKIYYETLPFCCLFWIASALCTHWVKCIQSKPLLSI